jgi:hypothetical protein
MLLLEIINRNSVAGCGRNSVTGFVPASCLALVFEQINTM